MSTNPVVNITVDVYSVFKTGRAARPCVVLVPACDYDLLRLKSNFETKNQRRERRERAAMALTIDVGLRHQQRRRSRHRAVIVGAIAIFERRPRQRWRSNGDDARQRANSGRTAGGRAGAVFRFKLSADSFDLKLMSTCSCVSHRAQKKVSTLMLSLQLCLRLERFVQKVW